MRTSDGLVIASAGVILYWFSYFKDENERNTIYNSVSLCGMGCDGKNENKWKSEGSVNFQFPKSQRDYPNEWEQRI